MMKVLFGILLVIAVAAFLAGATLFPRPPQESPSADERIELLLSFPPPMPEPSPSPTPTEPPPAPPKPSLSPTTPPPIAKKVLPELPRPPQKLTEPPATPPPPPPTFTSISEQEFYDKYAGSVIQIFCSDGRELFSASGVIVNPRGLVLTNAHVADIVTKVGADGCQARHGNPANSFAKVAIAFVPDTSEKIQDTVIPERDFAFLELREATEPFQIANIGTTSARRDDTLLTLGYPSEFLQGINAAANSNLVFSKLRVDGIADIDGDLTTADGYVFRGGLILQQGSSGTALFAPESGGEVVGIIFATTKAKTTDEREGVAISTSYIDRILRLETGQGLLDFVAGH